MSGTTETSAYRLQAVKYVQLASLALLIHDTIILLDQEVELIWSTKWTFPKVLYLISRYSPFLDTVIDVYDYLTPNPDPHMCHITYSIGSVLTMVGIAISELILILRTYALYDRSRKFFYFFGFLWVSGTGVASWAVAVFVQSIVFERRADPKVAGCYMAVVNPVVFICFMALFIVETFVVGFTLWKGFRIWRQVRMSSLLATFYKDSILFYLAIFPLTIGNIIVFLTAPDELLDLLDTMTRVFHSIFACRILLHLRSAANSRLLSSTTDAIRSNLSIGRFRVNVGVRDSLNDVEGVRGGTRPDEDAHSNFELAEIRG